MDSKLGAFVLELITRELCPHCAERAVLGDLPCRIILRQRNTAPSPLVRHFVERLSVRPGRIRRCLECGIPLRALTSEQRRVYYRCPDL